MKNAAQRYDAAAAQAMGEPVLASLYAQARDWKELLSVQGAALLVEVVAGGAADMVVEGLGHVVELAVEGAEKGIDLAVEKAEAKKERAHAGEYQGAKDARMKFAEYVYLVVTPTRFGIYHLKHLGFSLGKRILLAPREAIVGGELSGGHLIYAPLTWDLTLHTADQVTLRFGIHFAQKAYARQVHAMLCQETDEGQVLPHQEGQEHEESEPAEDREQAGPKGVVMLPSDRDISILTEEAIVGRSASSGAPAVEVDLSAEQEHATVSHRHARIMRVDDHFEIEDLNSLNKTRLNHEALEPGNRYPLHNGDVVEFGKVRCIFGCWE